MRNISVFFPCFNEEKNITKVVEEAITVLRDLRFEYEIIVINDGSTDKTEVEVKELIKKNKKIRLISHPTNLGYGAALKSGFYNSKYELIIYNDADGQFDFGEITKFLEKIKDYDLVVGYRSKRQDPFIRRLNGKIFNLVTHTLFRIEARDVDCGFKLLKKKVLEEIEPLEANGALISTELLYKTRKKGFIIVEVPVTHYPRTKGKPSGGSLKVIVKAMQELIRLRIKLR